MRLLLAFLPSVLLMALMHARRRRPLHLEGLLIRGLLPSRDRGSTVSPNPAPRAHPFPGPGTWVLLAAVPLLVTIAPVVGAAAAGVDSDDLARRLWAARYNGPGGGYDYGGDIGVSPDGSTVFVTGSSSGGANSNDYATVAYDAVTGSERWVSRYDGPAGDEDGAGALWLSPDGSTVFVTGASFGGATDYDYATVAYDAVTGLELWASRYDGTVNYYDLGSDIGMSPDGSTVFVTGTSYGLARSQDIATVAYDAVTGSELWASRYDSGTGYDQGLALAVNDSGSTVFVTGSSGDLEDYGTVAYDALTGSELWASIYDGPASGEDIAYDAGVSLDDSTVFVTGYSYGGSTSDDFATVAYDAATGSEVWAARYDGGTSEFANALGVSTDGSAVFVTGSGAGFATVAYDSVTGSELWVARKEGPGGAAGYALGVSPDGSTIFVTGFIYKGATTLYDYATVAYDSATGAKLWADVVRHRGSDFPYALAVSPDGSGVFITGGVQVNPDGRTDYGTVAYAT